MKQCYRDSCLFYYIKEGKLEGMLIFHVDDFLSSGSGDFQKDVIIPLREKYLFGKISSGDFTFTGLHIFQNKEM